VNRQECRKYIRGTIATVPTAFDEDYRLDLGRMAEMTQWWVSQGLGAPTTPIKVAAAMGEGPDLSEEEWPALLDTVVKAAGPNAAVLCGLQTKDTLRTIEDAKRAQDLGAKGLQIDLPIFHHSNHDDYVRYFSDISAAVDVGIMIYNTWWFGAVSMDAKTMLRLADTEHVVAIKWDVPPDEDYDAMREFAHLFNVIDNADTPARGHKNGGVGYISSHIAAYPPHDKKVWGLLEAHKYEEAQAEWDRVGAVLNPLNAKSSRRSGGYRMVKGMMAALGRPVGPTRPPTLPMDADEIAELRQALVGLGWIDK